MLAGKVLPNPTWKTAAESTLASTSLSWETTANSSWHLIQDTKHLCCYDPRDRVYALLSVTGIGHEGIEADYDMPVPTLLNRVLHNQYERCPPVDIKQVFAQCTTLESMFGLRRNGMNASSKCERDAAVPRSLQLDLDILKNTPGNNRNYYGYLRWAISYNHTHVIEVLRKAWRQQSFLGSRVEPINNFRGRYAQ